MKTFSSGFWLRAGWALVLALGILHGAWAQPAGRYAELQRQAAGYYSEQSYALAHQAWTEAAKLAVPPADRSTLDFYLADSLWRSRPEPAQAAEARKQLEGIAKGDDALAAEAAESLGDSWLALENDWNRAWAEYQRALKFWAASTELEAARSRYLGIVWKATGRPSREPADRRVPVAVLANALRIAPNGEESARAHFFLGRWYAAEGDVYSLRQAGREFQAAVDAGNETAVYESALFELARWNLAAGAAKWTDGQLVLEPDYDRALEFFRRFEREFPKGRSAYNERVAAEIAELTRPALELRAEHQFLPGGQPVVQAAWRNVGEVQLTLSRVDLTRDFVPTAQTNPEKWLGAVRVAPEGLVRQWKEGPGTAAAHAPQDREIKLAAMGQAGTYVLEARGGGLSARALLVVTEGAAVFQTVGDQVVAFFCNARTGAQAADAGGRLWRAREVNGQWRWLSVDASAKDGLATFALPKIRNGWDGSVFLLGRSGTQPVFARDRAWSGEENAEGWRVQVFTDRAAYRPGDAVNWKLIARKRKAGAYTTPGGELVRFVVNDPRGAKLDEGEVKLTEFGGAWGELPLRAGLPLGEYAIEFFHGKQSLGGQTLFRLEEYRLPEFKVGVAVAGDSQRGVRLGEEFKATISAEYYFGGAVADARVAVEVREEPFMRPLPWPEQSGHSQFLRERGGAARVVQSETLRTGPDGRVMIRVRTPAEAQRDLRYTITARVVDSSGREVAATGGMVVARQGYFVEMKPSRRVAFPNDEVTISLSARDGNERSVATPGTLTIFRQRWVEIWRDPQGREITGEALDRLKLGVFPPPGEDGWRLVKQEYVTEEIARDDLATDAAGRGAYAFRPSRAGFYRVAWTSPDEDGPPVTAETNIWVSAAAGGVLGYHSGGVEIIVDPSAPARGGKVPVLVTADTPGRDVFLLVHAGGDLFRAEVLHLEGDSKVVELAGDARFVPNVFVTAGAVRGMEFFADTKEIKFPPAKNALSVELRANAATAQPGAEASFRLSVKDAAGKPVRGEFALGVTDEAISAIQEDYAGNPVDFFLGEMRVAAGEPGSSISNLPFYRNATRGEEMAFSAPATRMMRRKNNDVAAADQGVAAAAVAGSPPVTVRSNFNATAFWRPGILTDEDGMATVKFKYPDSLTTWRAVLRGVGLGAEFGFAETTTRTSKPLIARLQAPRFLVAGDKAEISGVVNNRTAVAVTARADLRVEGLIGPTKSQSLRIDPDGDAQAAWALEAPQPGAAKLAFTAVAADANDGVALGLPIYPNGIEQSLCVGGKAADAEAKWEFSLPAKRRAGSESLVITATPSLAAAALDALPYLVTYPYGSVEQTMGRFLPAAVTARTLQSLGLDRAMVANRIYGGIEPEFRAKTHPKMDGSAGLDELDAAIAEGLTRLGDFQQADGAWGWWKKGESDAFMTAYVVWGLRLAQEAGVAVRSEMLDRGSAWLRAHLVDAGDDPNRQAWALHALAARHESGQRIASEERAALENLWAKRDQLTAYGRALFALAAQDFGETEKARTLARNLRDGVVRDGPPGAEMAHWGSEGGFREWQDAGVEATAFALQALLAIEPESELVEPAVNWLAKNRRGAQWSNTRDTAIAVLAMDRYLAVTKQLAKPVSFDLFVNGSKAGEARDSAALAGRSRFEIDRTLLRDGANTVELRRTAGDTPVYLSAQARFFSREQPIPAVGNEVFVKREYQRYAPQLTLLDGYRFDRIPWKIDESASTNERVEVVVTVEAKNDLEYVLVEDLKPAGLEAVDVRSGEGWSAAGPEGRRVPVYCELRDRKVAFFIRKLPAGVWTIRYDLRTETAGDFSALPVMGQAMYAPEIRGNGESRRVNIR